MRRSVLRCFCLLALAAMPTPAHALAAGRPVNPIIMIALIAAISLAPFLAIMMTSFVKISIVLAMIKSAFGTQIPPGLVTNGLALVLTVFIMGPVAEQMYGASGIKDPNAEVFAGDSLTPLFKAVEKSKEPLRVFLLKHAHERERELILSLSRRLYQGQAGAAQPAPPPPAAAAAGARAPRPDEEFRIVLPAFVISELKGAFQIGFVVLLPFLVLDVVVANVLVAAGLTMIQPAVVSLPLKLLLFVVADGWYSIVNGLVLSYS